MKIYSNRGKYIRKDLAYDECCYTCNHNRNNFADDYPCNCEFAGNNHTAQDMWCGDYDMVMD